MLVIPPSRSTSPWSVILLKKDDWIRNYIFWELELFKVLGYDLDFVSLVDEKIVDDKKLYISKSQKEKKVVPNFLVDKSQSTDDITTLLNGLKLITDYLYDY